MGGRMGERLGKQYVTKGCRRSCPILRAMGQNHVKVGYVRVTLRRRRETVAMDGGRILPTPQSCASNFFYFF